MTDTRCQWFLRCDNAATGTTPHPVLGDVPTCDRCAAFATDNDRPRSVTALLGPPTPAFRAPSDSAPAAAADRPTRPGIRV